MVIIDGTQPYVAYSLQLLNTLNPELWVYVKENTLSSPEYQLYNNVSNLIGGSTVDINTPFEIILAFYKGVPTQEEQTDPSIIPESKLSKFGACYSDGITPLNSQTWELIDVGDGLILSYIGGFLNPSLVASIDSSRGDTSTTIISADLTDVNEIVTGSCEIIGNRFIKLLSFNTPKSTQQFCKTVISPENQGQITTLYPIHPTYSPTWKDPLPNGGALRSIRNAIGPGGWDNSLLGSAGFITDIPENVSIMPIPSVNYSPAAPTETIDTPQSTEPEIANGWDYGRPWALNRANSDWIKLYASDGVTEWEHQYNTDYITVTSSAFGMSAEITNYPNLSGYDSNDPGSYDGVERIAGFGFTSILDLGGSVFAYLDVSGIDNPLVNTDLPAGSGYNDHTWGYSEIINRLEAANAQAGRIYVKVRDSVGTLLGEGYLDVNLEWLKLQNEAGITYY